MVVKFARFCRVFRRRRAFTIVSFVLFCISCLWYFGFVSQEEPIEYHHVRFGEHNQCANTINRHSMPKVSSGPKKLILFYTTIFDRITVFYPEEYKCCEPFHCEITTNKSKLLQSDAVIFHGRDLPKAKHMPIKPRNAKQRWVFYSLESPIHSKIVPSEYNGMFNWTMTYERRSDIFEPYGFYTKKITRQSTGLYVIVLRTLIYLGRVC